MGGCRPDDQRSQVRTSRALLAFVLTIILGKEALDNTARLHKQLISIVRSAQISWNVAEVSCKSILSICPLSLKILTTIPFSEA